MGEQDNNPPSEIWAESLKQCCQDFAHDVELERTSADEYLLRVSWEERLVLILMALTGGQDVCEEEGKRYHRVRHANCEFHRGEGEKTIIVDTYAVTTYLLIDLPTTQVKLFSKTSQPVSVLHSWVKIERKSSDMNNDRDADIARSQALNPDKLAALRELSARNEQVLKETSEILHVASAVVGETLEHLSSLQAKDQEQMTCRQAEEHGEEEEISDADGFESLESLSSRGEDEDEDEEQKSDARRGEGEEVETCAASMHRASELILLQQPLHVDQLRYKLEEIAREVLCAQDDLRDFNLMASDQMEEGRQEREKEREQEREAKEYMTSQMLSMRQQVSALEAVGQEISLLFDKILIDSRKRAEDLERIREARKGIAGSLQEERNLRSSLEATVLTQIQGLEEETRSLSAENKSLQHELAVQKQVYAEQVSCRDGKGEGEGERRRQEGRKEGEEAGRREEGGGGRDRMKQDGKGRRM
eukprot:756423-Hanusia_phi.AAC.2